MNTRKGLLGVLIGVGLFACAPSSEDDSDEAVDNDGAAVIAAGAASYRPGEYIVVLSQKLDAKAKVTLAGNYNARVFKTYEHVIAGFAARMSEADAQRLAKDPSVRYVERNGIKYLSEVQVQPNATWGIDRVDQVSLPLDQTYSYSLTGKGVTAVVIDSGVDARHPDFEGRVLPGFNATNTGSPDDASDVHGHGTHVAGTIASKTWGLAKEATIVPVRVCDVRGQCTDADILEGVEWVTRNVPRPAVVNMSLGGSVNTATLSTEEAIGASIASGITYVVAAGNNNRDACRFSPARIAEVITVGATTSSDRRSSFSNYGSCLDVFAPGSSIVSARRNSTGSTSMSGTSMASPHVAGVVALLLENAPTAAPAEMHALVAANATPDKVTNPGSGSPNLLLHNEPIVSEPPPSDPSDPPPSEPPPSDPSDPPPSR